MYRFYLGNLRRALRYKVVNGLPVVKHAVQSGFCQVTEENYFMLKQRWKPSLAVLTALSLGAGTIAPLIGLERSASAGIFAQQDDSLRYNRISQNTSTRVREGTTVEVEQPDGKRIIVTPDETVAVTLVTRDAVRSQGGTVLIPRGTKVEGEFRPYQDGTQFVARRLLLRDGTERNINARTNVVNYRKKIQRGTNTDPIWQGALVGGGASVLISSIVTRPGIFKTLAGAGAGALAGYLIGGRKRSEVIVVDPDQPLSLTFDSDLVLNRDY
jgi:hypothetical protein